MKSHILRAVDGLPQQSRPGASQRFSFLTAGFLLLGGLQFPACAQSDNFDSYTSTSQLTAAGWILSSIDPSLVTTTFPAVGSGKGLRIQSNPFPGQAPAVGMWYRTNSYTDFFVAVDIVNWPGTDKDQAAVMFARMTDASSGTVVNNQNPGAAQGAICNYDASQYGEDPGNRRQGQFQINVISAPFNANTLATADMTLVPGRSYRMTFKGVAWHYTAQIYDLNDLTTPLVTIEADDTVMANPNGACGILAYSRSATGTADFTFDNYYAGTTDPNPAAAPILAHPVAGTPAVDSRVPAARWKNFLSLSSPISFTANTYSTNVINAPATKFLLNGTDVSSKLTLSANGTNMTGSLPASVLTTNTLYAAQIIVTDLSGTRSSTNSFWFDTFSDAFLLSSRVKTVEAEEYNYNSGTFQLDPISVSGINTNSIQINGAGVGYYDVSGAAGIDFSNLNSAPNANFAAFRTTDPVRTLSGGLVGIEDTNHPTAYDPASDNVRSQHAASGLLEYVVCQTQTSEWLDYTRNFTPAFYAVYLRYSSFGSTSNELHLVTSDPTQPSQTTTKLGTFRIANNIRQANYLYTPLVDDGGGLVLANLAGTNTVRLLMAGTSGEDNNKGMLNYILFVQTSVQVLSSSSPNGSFALEPGAVVNVSNRTITVPVSGTARFYRLISTVPLSAGSISVSGSTVTLKL